MSAKSVRATAAAVVVSRPTARQELQDPQDPQVAMASQEDPASQDPTPLPLPHMRKPNRIARLASLLRTERQEPQAHQEAPAIQEAQEPTLMEADLDHQDHQDLQDPMEAQDSQATPDSPASRVRCTMCPARMDQPAHQDPMDSQVSQEDPAKMGSPASQAVRDHQEIAVRQDSPATPASPATPVPMASAEAMALATTAHHLAPPLDTDLMCLSLILVFHVFKSNAHASAKRTEK